MTLKEVRFAKTILEEKKKYFANPSASMTNKTTDKQSKGVVEGAKVNEESALFKLFG